MKRRQRARQSHRPIGAGLAGGALALFASGACTLGLASPGAPDGTTPPRAAWETLESLLGPWAQGEMVLGVRWITVVACLGVLVLAGLADLTLRWLVRRQVSRDRADAEAVPESERRRRSWIDEGLTVAVAPLALLLWIHGFWAAAAVLLGDVRGSAPAAVAQAGLDWTRGVATLAGLVWLLHRLSRVLEARLGEATARSDSAWDAVLIPLVGRTVRRLLPLLALVLGIPMLAVSPRMQSGLESVVSLLLIGAVALVLVQLVHAAETLLLRHYRIDVSDNLRARTVYTQVTVLRKVALAIIGIFTLASMLMVFDSVRQFGTSILASAGIAGIIVGFAAQRSIATLLAGFQIALTQPIRIDDVVIVENEWGRIEDITLTYVIVRIWDLRRLIVPITYFIERPFQNWTRTSAELLGSVFIHTDYTVPLDRVREAFSRIVEASPYWDGKVKVLQVTAATEHTLELRALASARDASTAWDLRCEIREKLIHFLQERYPESLPRFRAELPSAPRDAA